MRHKIIHISHKTLIKPSSDGGLCGLRGCSSFQPLYRRFARQSSLIEYGLKLIKPNSNMMHKTINEQIIYILSGSVHYWGGDIQKQLTVHDSILSRKGTETTYNNITNESVIALALSARLTRSVYTGKCSYNNLMYTSPVTRSNMKGGHGSLFYYPLFTAQQTFTAIRKYGVLEVPPGVSIGLHDHSGEEELYYVLSGNGLVNDGFSGLHPVSAGYSTITTDAAKHALINNGQENLYILTTVAKLLM